MTERSSYDHGTPSWVDLTSPDVEASKAFYGGLFGWTGEDGTDGEGNVIYFNFEKDGRLVAGLGAQQPETAGAPAFWNSYVNVDDVDEIVQATEPAGGSVMLPSMDVPGAGRMAIITDPTGAMLGLWQPREHKGAAVVNEPDTYAWNELRTRDIGAALAFYTDVFGWEYETMPMEGTDYHVIKGGDEGGLGGLMPMPQGFPEQVPNHWGVYFTVADADATAAKAKELGGTIVQGPDDTPIGRMASVHDPHGGNFSILQPAAQDDA